MLLGNLFGPESDYHTAVTIDELSSKLKTQSSTSGWQLLWKRSNSPTSKPFPAEPTSVRYCLPSKYHSAVGAILLCSWNTVFGTTISPIRKLFYLPMKEEYCRYMSLTHQYIEQKRNPNIKNLAIGGKGP